jgi:hypothetical protein
MSIEFDNNASGTISVQLEIIDTTLTLQTGEGALFPSVTTVSGDFFYATLEDTSGNIEIVMCTDNTSDVLTITRAQENTTAKQFLVGSKVENRTTAATFAEFIQRTGGTMTGALDLNGNVLQDPVITSTGAGTIDGLPLRGSDSGTANQLQVPSAGGAPTIGTSEIWHQGNDGPGTGLDADTLDGIEATGFLQNSTNPAAPVGDWTFTGDTILDGDHTEADFGTGGKVKDGLNATRPIGFNVMPVVEQDTSGTFDITTNGMLIHKDTTGAADFTLPNDADIPQGATWTVVADAVLAGLFRIKGDTGVTVRWFDQINETTTDVVAGNGFTLASGGVCTVYKYSDTVYFLWGGAIIESV